MNNPTNDGPDKPDPPPPVSSLKKFTDFLMDSAPMTRGMFNFLVWSQASNMFINVAISPLYRTMVKFPVEINVALGEHTFLASSDQPVYLLSMPDPLEDKHGVDVVRLSMPLGKQGSSLYADWYQKFEKPVEASFKYKIEKGILYKKESNLWQTFQLK